MHDDTGGNLEGVHHVTAICGDPVRNIAFYSGVLGLRLVKKTVNFDDPSSYHLYYGDAVGSPGTLITFFAWTGVPPLALARGRAGAGQIASVSFLIPSGSIEWWSGYLAAHAIEFDVSAPESGRELLVVRDPEGMEVELVAEANEHLVSRPWTEAPVPAEHAIRGVAGVTIPVHRADWSARVLTEVLGFRSSGSEGDRERFEIRSATGYGRVILVGDPEGAAGRMGIGAIHHVAWRVSDDAAQLRWRDRLIEAFLGATEVMDRQYFRSIYFNEPAGVVFEIATDGPGFTVDESEGELGSALRLPPWLEERRDRIIARLPELDARAVRGSAAGERQGA